MSAFRFIAAEKAIHTVSRLCRVLGVSRSGFYAWAGRPPSARLRRDWGLIIHIRRVHQISRATYGAPRVHAELKGEGIHVAKKRVARLMRDAGLEGAHRRRSRRTTLRDPDAAPASDLVERSFRPNGPDRLWVADITYIRTWAGWLYLAVVIDAYSRRVVGWAMRDDLKAELVVEALEMALWRRRPTAGLIHHSDRGCQYTSLAFGQKLRRSGVVASMGSRADCYDNAVAESFWATLKTELVHRHSWPTRDDARRALFDYIEAFYNPRRRHSTLGYHSPADYEKIHHDAAQAA